MREIARPKPRVLCVDDEPQILAGLKLNMRRVFELLTATNGAEALEIVARESGLAVIVSDMRMPGMDGLNFLARATELAPHAVRVLLTGDSDAQAVHAALEAGLLFRVLAKPCSATLLQDTMVDAVEQHLLLSPPQAPPDQT